MGKSCFLIGHRDSGAEIYPRLRREVERHAEQYGVEEFLVGHYGAFDAMAARAVLETKARRSGLRLTLLLPYHLALRPVALPPGFDGSYFPEGQERVPARAAIVRANEYAMRHCDYLLCYVTHPGSGARDLLEKALRREKKGLLRLRFFFLFL